MSQMNTRPVASLYMPTHAAKELSTLLGCGPGVGVVCPGAVLHSEEQFKKQPWLLLSQRRVHGSGVKTCDATRAPYRARPGDRALAACAVVMLLAATIARYTDYDSGPRRWRVEPSRPTTWARGGQQSRSGAYGRN